MTNTPKYTLESLESLDYQGLISRLEILISEKQLLSDLEFQEARERILTLIDDHVNFYLLKAKQLEAQAILALQNADNQIQQQADESLRNTVRAIAYPPPLPKLETLKNIPGMVDIYYKWHPEERPKFPIWKYSLAGLAVLVALTQWGVFQKTFFPTMADLQESGHITYDDSSDWQRPDPATEDTYRKPITNPYLLRYDNH